MKTTRNSLLLACTVAGILWLVTTTSTGSPKRTAPRKRNPVRHRGGVTDVAFLPDGKHILSVGGSDSGSDAFEMFLWRVRTGRVVRTFSGPSRRADCVAVSPNGKHSATGGMDGKIRFWNLKTGRQIRLLYQGRHEIRSLAISPNGKYLLWGGGDGGIPALNLVDVRTGRVTEALRGHTDNINSVAFGPRGKLAFSGSLDQTIRVWSVSRGLLVRTFKKSPHGVNTVSVSRTGRTVLSSFSECKRRGRGGKAGPNETILQLWNARTGRPRKTIRGHKETVIRAAFSPDGKHILSADCDGGIKLWSSTGRFIRDYDAGNSNRGANIALFGPKGKKVVTVSGSWDHLLRIFSVRSGKLLSSFKLGR